MDGNHLLFNQFLQSPVTFNYTFNGNAYYLTLISGPIIPKMASSHHVDIITTLKFQNPTILGEMRHNLVSLVENIICSRVPLII